jgi:hypothetical protein
MATTIMLIERHDIGGLGGPFFRHRNDLIIESGVSAGLFDIRHSWGNEASDLSV